MQFVNWTLFIQEIVINLEMLKASILLSVRHKKKIQKLEEGGEILSPHR